MPTVGDDSLADGTLAGDFIAVVAGVTATSSLAVSEAWTPVVLPRATVDDNITLGVAHTLHYVGSVHAIEAVSVSEQWRLLLATKIVEAFSLTSSFVPYVNFILKQAVKVTEQISASFKFNLTQVERFKLLDVLLALGHFTIGDSLAFTDQIATSYFAGASISELIQLVGGFTNNVILTLKVSDALNVDDDTLLNFIYSATITETIEADVAYVSPDGSVTSWAINTRTSAVTQYENFVFNSFAAMGTKYIAADEQGVYELNGPRDLTENIVARVGGGYLEMNAGKLAGLKGVYLGIGGQGAGGATWLLKLLMGDGREFIYQRLSNPSLMTTKFDIGKGLRARYMSWELCNQDGQDFDFDTIEFVPMMSGRRIG